jgi:hypothetical protein
MIEPYGMDEAFQVILDSLPPKQPRSRLEPYTELIHELRKRGRSYREIVGILGDRCGIQVGVHTVYNFVRVRTTARGKRTKATTPSVDKAANLVTQSAPLPATVSEQDVDHEVWQRIRALKNRSVPAPTKGAEKVFHYDENMPLTVTPPKKGG